MKAALIDMDGVLYDSMKYHTLAWEKIMTEVGIPCTRDEFYLYEGMTGEATIDLLFMRHFGRPATEEEKRSIYNTKTYNFVRDGKKELMPGTDKVLRIFKDAGLKCVLVTGSAQSSIIDEIDTDYPGIFDDKVTANDVTNGKPHPEPYLQGAMKAGVDPKDCLVLENAPLGVQAGKAAGCFVIAVTTGPIPEEEMRRAGADLVFPNMEELARHLPEILRPHPTKNVKCRGGVFLREFRDALREQWGSIVTEGQHEIHQKDAGRK